MKEDYGKYLKTFINNVSYKYVYNIKNELNQKIKYLRNIRKMLLTEVNLVVNFFKINPLAKVRRRGSTDAAARSS